MVIGNCNFSVFPYGSSLFDSKNEEGTLVFERESNKMAERNLMDWKG